MGAIETRPAESKTSQHAAQSIPRFPGMMQRKQQDGRTAMFHVKHGRGLSALDASTMEDAAERRAFGEKRERSASPPRTGVDPEIPSAEASQQQRARTRVSRETRNCASSLARRDHGQLGYRAHQLVAQMQGSATPKQFEGPARSASSYTQHGTQHYRTSVQQSFVKHRRARRLPHPASARQL